MDADIFPLDSWIDLMAAVFCQGHHDTPENISAREYLDIWSQIIRSMQIIHYQLREQLLAKSMDPPQPQLYWTPIVGTDLNQVVNEDFVKEKKSVSPA